MAGIIGNDRKCGFFLPFILSVILTPIVGIVISVTSKKIIK